MSISDCMKAVEAVTAGDKTYDEAAAIEWLQQNGVLKAAKFENRDTRAGIIYAYIHHDKSIGVLLKLTCETDFVAKNDKFTELAKNLCMHIVASSPTYISIDRVDSPTLESWQKDINTSVSPKIPANKREGAIAGMLDKQYYQQYVLLEQPYVLDTKHRVKDIVKQLSAAFGENISIASFTKEVVGR